jgi:hypothetical protein
MLSSIYIGNYIKLFDRDDKIKITGLFSNRIVVKRAFLANSFL